MSAYSNNKTIAPLLAVVVATLLGGCGADEQPSTKQSSLIGGEEAKAGKFDATVYLWLNGTGCTGARVGPREILTAAHCVRSMADGSWNIASNDWFALTNDKVLAGASWSWARVRSVRIHPAWATACASGCANNTSLQSPYPPDVALITSELLLPNHVPQAKIYWGPLPKSKLVTVVGYGCENGVDKGGSSRRLKFEETAAVKLSPSGLDAAYIGTQGQKTRSSEASLCPGDSGGPLYKGRSNTYIVGVNAYYRFKKGDESGISTYNTHTRLGTKSPHDVTEWLMQFLPAGSVVGPG
jgi:hypothetical protein